ncbi:MAG: DUF3943 domain-containing protein [Phocaeicola sp.]
MRHFTLLLFFLFAFGLSMQLPAQRRVFNQAFAPDSTARPFRALAFSQIPNLSIWGINRYGLKSDFAYINLETMAQNILQQPLWDYDQFGTNLLTHPLHGGLDFTAARINGLTYYQSIPYAFVSSLIWEYLLENEPASINDQITTTLGGALFGELSFRLSSSILKSESVGLERVCREFFGALTNPLGGIDRALTGKMWRVSAPPTHYQTIPISLVVETGARWLSQPGQSQVGSYLALDYQYGSPMKESSTPFESFRLNAVFDPFAKKSLITQLAVTGALLTKSTHYKKSDITYGLFQHFLYMDALSNNNQHLYYRYSEPATLGFGLLTANSKSSLMTQNYFNALFLAAAHASPFELLHRSYNFGFGYGLHHTTSYVQNRLQAKVDLRLSQFFTTVGYAKETNLAQQDYTKFYAMGDKGSTLMINCQAHIDYRFYKELSLSLKYHYIRQQTRNRDFPNFSLEATDCYLGLNYRFK